MQIRILTVADCGTAPKHFMQIWNLDPYYCQLREEILSESGFISKHISYGIVCASIFSSQHLT